jgi:hypothetical protein
LIGNTYVSEFSASVHSRKFQKRASGPTDLKTGGHFEKLGVISTQKDSKPNFARVSSTCLIRSLINLYVVEWCYAVLVISAENTGTTIQN